MNLDAFLAPATPVERQVTLPDGSKQAFHFITPSAAEVRQYMTDEADPDKRQHSMQRLVAASLYDNENNRLAIQGDDIYRLTWEGCLAFFPVVAKLAGITREKKSESSLVETNSASS